MVETVPEYMENTYLVLSHITLVNFDFILLLVKAFSKKMCLSNIFLVFKFQQNT